MKNFYLVFSAQLDGKNYAGTMAKTGNENIMNLSGQIPGMTAANLCASKKEAEQIADAWNAAYKRNGTALFT